METYEMILWLLLAMVALVVAAVLVTTQYWRNIIRQNEEIRQFEMSQIRFEVDNELKHEKSRQKKVELSQQKEKVATAKETKRALDKVDLVYNILHDVQSVHQGVDGYLRLMMDVNLELSQADWETMCHDLMKKSHLLNEMVDCAIELLQYRDMADVPCNDDVLVNSFCQDMFDACQRYLKNDSIDMVFETSLPDDYILCTNLSYLRKLIKNLLICSMNYTKQGYIKMTVIEEPEHHRLQFIVSDTGIGIPEHARKNLFERLPNDSLKNKITVVRLHICHALTHLLGGNIYIDPFYKGGTSVVFGLHNFR